MYRSPEFKVWTLQYQVLGHTQALSLFLLSRLQCPALWVISQPSSAAKDATPLVCLMSVRATWALPLFLLSRLQQPAPRVASPLPTMAKTAIIGKASSACRG